MKLGNTLESKEIENDGLHQFVLRRCEENRAKVLESLLTKYRQLCTGGGGDNDLAGYYDTAIEKIKNVTFNVSESIPGATGKYSLGKVNISLAPLIQRHNHERVYNIALPERPTSLSKNTLQYLDRTIIHELYHASALDYCEPNRNIYLQKLAGWDSLSPNQKSAIIEAASDALSEDYNYALNPESELFDPSAKFGIFCRYITEEIVNNLPTSALSEIYSSYYNYYNDYHNNTNTEYHLTKYLSLHEMNAKIMTLKFYLIKNNIAINTYELIKLKNKIHKTDSNIELSNIYDLYKELDPGELVGGNHDILLIFENHFDLLVELMNELHGFF